MSCRIGIAGITGRMGRLLVEEVASAGSQLTGGTRNRQASEESGAVRIFPSVRRSPPKAMSSSTSPARAPWRRMPRRWSRAARLGCWEPPASRRRTRPAVAAAAARIPVVYAANFSAGVTLLLAFAERMAAALPAAQYDAEILEMHHRQKVDAPSGTALALGRAVAAGRGVDLAGVMQSGRDGHTGPRATGAIGFATLRGGQVVGEHSLLFAAADEQIILTHRAFDRRTFASGAVRAALWAEGQPPGPLQHE